MNTISLTSESAMNEGRSPPIGTPDGDAEPFTVLVVDDDPDISAFLMFLLKSEGLSARSASNGHEAMAAIGADPPDLVLMDVLMPGMDGFEACRKLRENPATALLPIVLVTGLDDRVSRVRGIEAGADDFLTKPIQREELIARVRTLRRLENTRRELERQRAAEEVAKREHLRQTFQRYISRRVADRILEASSGEDGIFRNLSERTAVVALFADLRGFTRLSETVPVARIVPMLNEFFGALTDAAHEEDGTVFSMAGDSLLVGFNVPVVQPDAAERALRTARGMIYRFSAIGGQWRREFGLSIGVGVGIEAGEVVAGNVGSPSFMSYTIIGDAVNVAARLMQMAAGSEILLGPAVVKALGGKLDGNVQRTRRDVIVRGKAQPVEVMSVHVHDQETHQ
jgi:class 3 adenylate cyclase